MKIAILGTRGIPNQYGGFEQFAECVTPSLVKRGHEVCVYNSSLHPYNEREWNGVQLIKKWDIEDKIGTTGQFIYDLNCILDSRKRNFDIILQLGYTSSSVWGFLFPHRSLIVTNMDGLEWKRTKYSKSVQRFLKKAEAWAVKRSDHLVADSKGIQLYLKERYNADSTYIAYGASVFTKTDATILQKFQLSPFKYDLLIARMEPENNVETILKGHRLSGSTVRLVVVGGYGNRFGKYLKGKYSHDEVLFAGPIYDADLLNNLRYYSRLYFHGHSVGGTNPSLLEAMAASALVVSHDNIFNRSILGDAAFYFKNADDIADILRNPVNKQDHEAFLQSNRVKIESEYSWDKVIDDLENLFVNLLHANR
jgi:glycosyltransferase involved in cell wall biosynthesis